ncbi:MAG: hypothetical protein QNI87_15255 [Erythrobacter sp.]|uniref:hypothetical protein n=1 Tax=Erythrobacter sp. TaxID=1042 RepID=UPI002624C9E7|nr:hypothetical protein [Erythrobacter sp.]MDJ0979882.1 hypothetical protein [Erythrobacter sp.]
MTDKDQRISRKLVTIAALSLGAGVIGYFGGYAFGETSVETGYELSMSVIIALAVAVMYLTTAGLVLVGTAVPKFGENVLNVEDAEEIEEMRAMVLNSAFALGSWGAALLVIALAEPAGPISPLHSFLVSAAGIVLGCYFAAVSYRHSDELMMAVNREAAVWAYGLVFCVIGGWAMAAHADLLAPPAPLDVMTGFYALVLLATCIAAGRRGMLKLR